jgi:hypothetical protein
VPYNVVKRGTKWVVQKKDGSKTFGTHGSKADAKKQLAALYANEPKAAALRALHLLDATGPPRTEMLDGREHLVVPVVALIGDNVIHAVNAPEAEFVPAKAVAASQGWNGRPLMYGHPTEGGRQISANADPRVVERQGFGFLSAQRMNGKRLGLEAWIDVARLAKLDAKMLENVRAGRPVEVSVGAYVQTRAARGETNGKVYKTEWATITPDHLAFLPDTLGACSIDMGCGANRAAMRVTDSDTLETLMEQSIIDPETLRFCRDVPQSERDEMDPDDFAGPDQSFPIKKQADVDAAKHLIGKAKNPAAVKAKVIAIAKRKGLTIPDAWKKGPKAAAQRVLDRVMKILARDAAEATHDVIDGADDDDESYESVTYEAMRALLESAQAALESGRTLVDELCEGEDTPGWQRADDHEDVEDAKLEAVVAMCMQVYGCMNGVIKQANDCLSDGNKVMTGYEGTRAAAGARHNKVDQGIVQQMHDHSVQLGADCPGARAAERGDHTCGCHGSAEESNMNATERAAAVKALSEIKHADFTQDELKGLALLSDKGLAQLRTMAAKSPADALIQAKYNADAALAGHAHGLNMQDAADASKKTQKMKDDLDKNKEDKEDEEENDEEETGGKDEKSDKRAAALKAAQKAGFQTVEEHEEARWLERHPAVKAVVERAAAVEASRKNELVNRLKTLGSLTEEQLRKKSIDQLEELAAFAKVNAPRVDFSGRGLATLESAESQEEADRRNNPPSAYDEALKKRRAASGR